MIKWILLILINVSIISNAQNYAIDLSQVQFYGHIYNYQGIDIVNPPHAYMVFSDSSNTIALSKNTWSQITNASDSLFRVLEHNSFEYNADTLYPPSSKGHYNIFCAISFEAGTGNEHEVRLITNNGELSKMNFENGNYEKTIIHIIIYTDSK